MARPTQELITALRSAADRIASGSDYEWGHMGRCNCGHLVQSITGLTQAEIHQSALIREGDWEGQAREYCPTSGLLIDSVIAAVLDVGMTLADIKHLEKLTDPVVLSRLPEERRYLQRNARKDVILYMRAWADMLDRELLSCSVVELLSGAGRLND
jgi:hypothetical protein